MKLSKFGYTQFRLYSIKELYFVKHGKHINFDKFVVCYLRVAGQGHLAVTRPIYIPYPTAFPYGNGMVLHFYQQQESSTTKTVHKVINKGLKAYV